ncbi:MAG TPA: hemolysin family protein [Phenylobacterium sp.]|nr:hemolysin family protein [Phenylobacterium sp.]
MPSDGSTPAPGPRHSRGVRALLRRFRKARPAASEPEPMVQANGHDLVDQAQAFQSLRVEDVMTPRADIISVEISTPLSEVVSRFVEAEHSRMPIYRETMDDPVGVVHVKDVFRVLASDPPLASPDEAILRRLRREVLYVPGSMRAADLMVRMQASRIHMALVIDEFGGTDGLVTLEDLVEAVVGDIDDEHDEAASAPILTRPGGVFEADARAPLEDLEAAVEARLTPEDLEEEVDTVAGLVTTLAGRVPQRGEVIAHPGGFEFEVLDADPRRVKRVRLRPATAAPATEAAP